MGLRTRDSAICCALTGSPSSPKLSQQDKSRHLSMRFALQCLAVMNVEGISKLPNFYDHKRRVEKDIWDAKKLRKPG